MSLLDGYQKVDEGENHYMLKTPHGVDVALPKKDMTEAMHKAIASLDTVSKAEDQTPQPEPSQTMNMDAVGVVPPPAQKPQYFMPTPTPGSNMGPIMPEPKIAPAPINPNPAPKVAPYQPINPFPAPASQPGYNELGYGQAFNMANKAADAEAAAKEAQAKAQADVISPYIKQLQDTQANFQAKRGELDAEHARLQEDVSNYKIDPNHFWNKQTGIRGGANKIMALVGLFLGGNAQLKTGVNPAQAVIDKAIAEDIDAQKATLGQKQSLLKDNLEKYGNLKDAEMATELNMKSIFDAQLGLAAAQTASPLVKAQALKERAAINLQMAQLKDGLAQRYAQNKVANYAKQIGQAAFMGGLKGPQGDALVMQLPEDQRKQLVKVITPKDPAGTWLPARSEDDAKEVVDIQQAANNAMALGDKMLEYAQKPGASELTKYSDKGHEAKQLQNQALQSYSLLIKAAGGRAQNISSESAMQMAEDAVPDPSALNNTAAQKDIQGFIDHVNSIKEGAYANRLFNYSPQSREVKKIKP